MLLRSLAARGAEGQPDEAGAARACELVEPARAGGDGEPPLAQRAVKGLLADAVERAGSMRTGSAASHSASTLPPHAWMLVFATSLSTRLPAFDHHGSGCVPNVFR